MCCPIKKICINKKGSTSIPGDIKLEIKRFTLANCEPECYDNCPPDFIPPSGKCASPRPAGGCTCVQDFPGKWMEIATRCEGTCKDNTI